MRIGVIAAEMEGKSTGAGRYLEGILDGLDCWNHGCEWHLFFQGEVVPSAVPAGDSFFCHCSKRGGSRVLWEQLRLPRELGEYELDVLFGPSYSLPLSYRGPSAVSIHDLSFEILPQEFGPKERWRRRLLARRSARVAQHIFVPADHIRDEVVQRYPVSPDEVSVIPLGVKHSLFSPQSSDADQPVLAELGITGPYVLWLGTILERRMPQQVLQAFAGITRQFPDQKLVIAGANRLRRPAEFRRWINDLGIADSVVELGWVDERWLAPLYRGASVAVYVSHYEGFGLPPLECLACATPVVVSRGLGLDDLWPDYPLRCRDFSAEAIQENISRVLRQPVMAGGIAAEAVDLSRQWSWETTSRALVALLRKVARP